MDIKLCVILCTLLIYGYCQEGLQCPDGWVPLSGICYKFGKTAVNFSEASSVCEEQGGHLLRVKDREKYLFALDLMIWQGLDSVWLAITKEEDTCDDVICRQQGWVWQDGTRFEPTVEFNPWSGSVLEPAPGRQCAYINLRSYGNAWVGNGCSAYDIYFICEKAAPCDSGWDENGGRCYKFVLTYKYYYEATAECATDGATLLTLSGEEEYNFIKLKIAVRGLTRAFWLGLNYTGQCGSLNIDLDCRRRNYEWQDGTKYQYPTWHYWRTTWTEPGPQELCARMNRNYAWYGENCARGRSSYICVKELNGASGDITTSTTTTTTATITIIPTTTTTPTATTTTTPTTTTTTTTTTATPTTTARTKTITTSTMRTSQATIQMKSSLTAVTSPTTSSSPESTTTTTTQTPSPIPVQPSASSLASSAVTAQPGASSTTLESKEHSATQETTSPSAEPATQDTSADNPDSMPMYAIRLYTLIGVIVIVLVIVAIVLLCKRRNNMERGVSKPTHADATQTDVGTAASTGTGVTPIDAGYIDILPGQPASQPTSANTHASQPPVSRPSASQTSVAQPHAALPATAQPIAALPTAPHPSAIQNNLDQPTMSQSVLSLRNALESSASGVSQPPETRPSVSRPVTRVSGVSYVNDTELGYERPIRQDNVYQELQ